jgi:hypothetical protein
MAPRGEHARPAIIAARHGPAAAMQSHHRRSRGVLRKKQHGLQLHAAGLGDDDMLLRQGKARTQQQNKKQKPQG